MVNNLGFRWPTPLFFMVLGAHGRVYNRFLVVQIQAMLVFVVLNCACRPGKEPHPNLGTRWVPGPASSW